MKDITNISLLAKDIINYKIDDNLSLKDIRNGFYKILRKHSIKQGTPNPKGNGRTRNTPEWVMANELFYSRVMSYLNISDIFGKGVPKDLLGFPSKSKLKRKAK